MSQRTRSVEWIEGRITSVLAKVKAGKHPTTMALSAMTLNFEMRNLEEQHNFDLALFNLIREGSVIQFRDEKGFASYKLAA